MWQWYQGGANRRSAKYSWANQRADGPKFARPIQFPEQCYDVIAPVEKIWRRCRVICLEDKFSRNDTREKPRQQNAVYRVGGNPYKSYAKPRGTGEELLSRCQHSLQDAKLFRSSKVWSACARNQVRTVWSRTSKYSWQLPFTRAHSA